MERVHRAMGRRRSSAGISRCRSSMRWRKSSAGKKRQGLGKKWRAIIFRSHLVSHHSKALSQRTMKNISRLRQFKSRLRTVLSLAVVSAALVPLALITAAEDKAEKAPKTEKPTEPKSGADASNKKPKAAP